jgi:hypothetical protein
MAKNKLPKEEPMNACELVYTSQLAKMCGFQRENVINSKGLFPALRVITNKTFSKDDIKLIQKGFKKRFNRILLFTERKESNGTISVGYFTKQALV